MAAECEKWHDHAARLQDLLMRVEFHDHGGAALTADAGFARWQQDTETLRAARRTVFLIGNGASASMASHLAADLAKNAHVHTEVFTDLALITAISNDMGYDQVFVEPLRRRAEPGDMLVAISSSGRSPNILGATTVARELGLGVVTLSAMAPGNPLRRAGDLNVYLPAPTYGDAETCHAAVLHYWMDLMVATA